MYDTTNLPKQILDLECSNCKKINKYLISLMSPKSFCNPSKATMLIQYRCKYCDAHQGARIKFKEEEDFIFAILLEEVEVKKSFIPPNKTNFTVRPKQKSLKG